MCERLDVTAEHLRGPFSEALANPALRRAIANCAEIRKRRELARSPRPMPVDLKRRAAGDND
jgi:hypothetical protein